MKRPLMRFGIVLQHISAGDVRGHQVGSELDAAEGELEDLGDGAHQQRLGQAGNTLEQAVAAGEQCDQQLVDDFVLSDDRLADLGPHAAVGRGELIDRLAAGRRRLDFTSFPVSRIALDHLGLGDSSRFGDFGGVGHGAGGEGPGLRRRRFMVTYARDDWQLRRRQHGMT